MTRCLWRPISMVLIACIWPLVLCKVTTLPGWIPASRGELRKAIKQCWRQSTRCCGGEMVKDCSKGPHGHGPIWSWDVSNVTDMGHLLTMEEEFTGDISTWDVSRVTNMEGMFLQAVLFNGDLSQWDVSSVIHMEGMFMKASAFNSDISKWNVSSVAHMDRMFYKASSFAQSLCGAWLTSKASKFLMFEGSSGAICTRLSPGSNEELRLAIETCVSESLSQTF